MGDKQYPEMPKHLHTAGYLSTSLALYTADQMREYVDADRAMHTVGVSALQGKVTRHSDQSVLVTFPSSRLASEFEQIARAIESAHGIAARKEQSND